MLYRRGSEEYMWESYYRSQYLPQSSPNPCLVGRSFRDKAYRLCIGRHARFSHSKSHRHQNYIWVRLFATRLPKRWSKIKALEIALDHVFDLSCSARSIVYATLADGYTVSGDTPSRFPLALMMNPTLKYLWLHMPLSIRLWISSYWKKNPV